MSSTDVSTDAGGVQTGVAASGNNVPGDSTQPDGFPGGTPTGSSQPVEFTGAGHRDDPCVRRSLLTVLVGIVLFRL